MPACIAVTVVDPGGNCHALILATPPLIATGLLSRLGDHHSIEPVWQVIIVGDIQRIPRASNSIPQ